MPSPWLHIIGIGEDGEAGLSGAALEQLQQADVILGGDRHQRLASNATAQRLTWPSPFDAMIETITAHKGRRFVILVTGDPLWYSVGARIARAIGPSEIVFHPQLSAFQFATARMGWSLADCETLTVHGRPVEQMLPYLRPGARLLLLTKDSSTPSKVASLLTECGFGRSEITALAALGGPDEQRLAGSAAGWDQTLPDFHTLAIECVADSDARILPRGPGLPDDAFEHDGKMTKSDVRAVTLARLAPGRGEYLWDIGLGCGSVAIEWMRIGIDARAVGLEPKAERRAIAARNAERLGAPALDIRDATAPDGLAGLRAPDAVFIGGGLSEETFDICWANLRPYGRLVVNAVTLESEALLLDLHARYGGDLTRLAVSRAEPVGPYRGWRPSMPVTQLFLTKAGS
ncbi:MAG: precorrin-6y C5,15-methyltransferase (decarboxylating) subunit CbiE [Pseudomonadota bacterium]